MIQYWFQDLVNWFKARWLDWVIFILYVGVLYWMASRNWQVIHFPIFIVAFILLTFGLVITYRYISDKA